MTKPRYQEVKAADIPTDHGGRRYPRAGCLRAFWGKDGPIDGIAAEPIYLDVSVAPGGVRRSRSETHATLLRTCSPVRGKFCNASGPLAVPTEPIGWLDTSPPTEADNRSLDPVRSRRRDHVQAGEEGIRFLLVSGKPLDEPVAWYGPIVMNTQSQLRDAFSELQEGTFLKDGKRK